MEGIPPKRRATGATTWAGFGARARSARPGSGGGAGDWSTVAPADCQKGHDDSSWSPLGDTLVARFDQVLRQVERREPDGATAPDLAGHRRKAKGREGEKQEEKAG